MRTPPAASPRSDALARALEEAAGEGDRYVNRLALETSPYLLQHAHNPVDWWPWGDAAFEEARRADKPVLLSVGYATCHWCHVMERESFEDEGLAETINRYFVPIKVDREERPDVDAVYMTAVQALTGQGGWPMNVWLDHERVPFYAGTYFPPDARWGRPGFATILERLHEVWARDRGALKAQAAQVGDAVRGELSLSRLGGARRPGPETLRRAGDRFLEAFDPEWGGFGAAPKFPRTEVLRLLLRIHRRTGDARLLVAVTKTLQAMDRGGIHDHLGGGFARYSTDRRWLVPHFEKMLYDNALMATAYLEAFQATGTPRWAEVVEDVLAWVAREMTSPEGAFFSAVDADSEGEEGRFYVWRPGEIDDLLGPERGRLVRACYGVTEGGNFEGGATVLHLAEDPEAAALRLGEEPARVREVLRLARPVLYAARAKRVPPLTDDKILAGWNGLMASAFARAGRVLGRPDHLARAGRAVDFVLSKMQVDGRLRRAFRDGRARHDAGLEDHAFLAAACLDLFEAAGEARRLDEATALMEQVEARFRDPRGGWFSTPSDGEALLTRPREVYDGVVPAGSSVAAMTALRLAALTGERRWREAAEAAVEAVGEVLETQPTVAPTLLGALDWILDRPWEVVVVAPGGANLSAVDATLGRGYRPNAVEVRTADGAPAEALAAKVPLLAGRRALDGRPTIYVCREGTCLLPTTDPEAARRTLGEVRPLE